MKVPEELCDWYDDHSLQLAKSCKKSKVDTLIEKQIFCNLSSNRLGRFVWQSYLTEQKSLVYLYYIFEEHFFSDKNTSITLEKYFQ